MLELPYWHVVLVEDLVVLVVILNVGADHLVVDDSWLNALLILLNFALVAQPLLNLFLHNSNYFHKLPRGVLGFWVFGVLGLGFRV